MIRRHYPPQAVPDQTARGADAHPMRISNALAAAAIPLALALMGGCIYRVNIPQGNYLEAKMIDQLQVGMTRSQVRYVLGTPMIADPFHPDQWDYLYYFKEGKTRKVETRLVVVHFTDEKVSKVERPEGEFRNPTVHTAPVI
ncbi:MAG TPA: outer membrane protein assembly factor BamE [Steroidobacteraceae bacterium]|nr:outer membrane protein assembly factor BamE [Steroidobacteraceae bacterium]